MRISTVHVIALLLILLIVYTFVTAPSQLADTRSSSTEAMIPIQLVLDTIAAENDTVRTLYTRSIVGAGLKAGLRFDEKWKDDDVQAGPLPALFLREAANSIEMNPVPIGLFLGSHQPIASSNRFSGVQSPYFAKILNHRRAEHFYDQGSRRWTAMFPDFASVAACVNCHNEHPDSPKKDWVLNDVMGATTWSYPRKQVTSSEFMAILAAVRSGFRDAYRSYLEEIETFDEKPQVGSRWPGDGFAVPDEETFMAEFERQASPATVNRLIEQQQ